MKTLNAAIMTNRKYLFTPSTVLEGWAFKFPAVQVWLKKLNGTKAHRAYLLFLFCDWAKKDPEELLKLKSDCNSLDAERLLDDFIVKAEYPECTRWNCVTTVRSFFRCNYRALQAEAGRMEYVGKRAQRTPSKEKRLALYESCFNQRDRALVCVACTSGIALETFTNLKWEHFEKDWMRQEFPHISIPGEFIKGHGKGKYRGLRQETFLTPLTKRELIKYREWMTKTHGILWNESMNVFLSLERPYNPLTYHGLSKTVEAISAKADTPFSVHDGRRIVETALESVGCPRNWIQKIKGRKVRGEDAPYSKPLIEQLRQKYKEAAAELEFLGSGAHGREDLNLTDAEWKDLRELLALMKQGKVRIT
jgi:hypothetical protein